MLVAINECVLLVISYSFGVVNWTESELKEMDIGVRKLLNMCRMLEIRSDVDRIYIPRNQGGCGLISIWDACKSKIKIWILLILN